MSHDFDPANLTRRDFLLAAGLFGTGLILDACGATNTSNANNVQTPATPDTTTTSSTTSPPAAEKKESLFSQSPTWEQDFTKMPDGKIDPRFWSIDTGNVIPGYNNEAETLTDRPENVRIQDGLLILEAKKEPLNGKEYTSGRINTQDKFSFQYGKIEVDLRAPVGIGTWPAAWLLPNAASATWPLDGEIDFFECVGAEPGQFIPDVHTFDTEKANQNNDVPVVVPNMSTEFNTYGVELTQGKIAFTFNGETYKSVEQTSEDHESWPFDQQYFLILNLSMGGSWGGEKRKQYPPDGIQGDGPWDMAVKAVRFYDLSE